MRRRRVRGHLEGHEPPEGWRRDTARDHRLVDGEPGEILLGQVDAPHREVLGDVLEVLDELQRRAHPARELQGVLVAPAEDREDESADRIRRQRAVRPERLVRRVPRRHLVVAIRLDEIGERLTVEAEFVREPTDARRRPDEKPRPEAPD